MLISGEDVQIGRFVNIHQVYEPRRCSIQLSIARLQSRWGGSCHRPKMPIKSITYSGKHQVNEVNSDDAREIKDPISS